MSLFIVCTGWIGNGHEAIVVEADDEDQARSRGMTAYVEHWRGELQKTTDSTWWQINCQKHLDTPVSAFTVERIELPYLCEID